MPIYEYKCGKCGNFFEELVASSRSGNVPCSLCGSAETQKCVSAIGGISVKGASAAPPCAAAGGCPGMSSCAGAGGCHL